MLPISSTGNSQQCLIWILLTCLSVHGQITQASQKRVGAALSNSKEYLNVKRSDFRSDFVFGASTAAAQIEGSTKSGGRGPSVWDQFVRKFPDKIMDKSTLEVAVDSYKRYKDLGVDAYRFSIPWTRILPDGTLSGGINQEGINHYNSLIDELTKHGIKPFVTIMHFDLPEALENKYGGFLNRTVVENFKNYAEICFKTLGDRVKNWITINEPLITAKFGYTMGVAPPGRCSDRATCPAEQAGQIGMSLVGQYSEPYSNTFLDRAAAKRSMDFELGWFMEPLVRGDYPISMRRLVKDRLPVFTAEERKLVKGSFDFIGINYYTSRYAKHIPINPQAAPVSYLVDQHVNSTGFTEKNDPSIPIPQALNDQNRIEFVQKHLHQIRRAINNDVNVKGYFYWSLFDDFEWSEGFTVRYGLYYVDFKNLKRIPKKSAKWYHDFIKGERK
ncbi:hypothetical protein CRYUN_Cryun13aG0018800 [Craigia yunnanensis]